MTSPPHHPHPAHHPRPAAQPAPAPEPKDLPSVKSWAYPFATNSGKNPPDAQDYLQALGSAGDGFYPLGANGIWHGGIHFDTNTDGVLKQGDGVRAIADGEIVAYRLDSKYVELNYSDGRKARYSTGFVLLHHKLVLPPLPDPSNTNSNNAVKSPPPDEVLDFYSLYMHQSDWASYQEAEKAAPPSTDPTKPTTPAMQRMPFWQGNAYYRVGSKADDKQLPSTTSPDPTVQGAAPAPRTPLLVGQRIRDKANGKILGLLPQGSELTLSATSTPGWATIASISKGALVPYVQGGDLPPEASNGWIHLAELVSLIDPSPLDTVVVLPKPFRVKAGALLGYPGQYVRHGDASPLPAASTSRPLVHLEVFAGDAFRAFLDKSRDRANKLPDSQKTLLVVSPGAALVDVSPAVDQKVPIGLTLEPVAGKAGSGRWMKVQPTRITPAHPTSGHPHPQPNKTKEGDPFWAEREASGTIVSGVVNGWKEFPLHLSNPKVATASFMDVFTPAELTRLDVGAKAVDDADVQWWKIEVGTGTGQSGSGWVCGKGHPNVEWQSPWAWPGFEVVDGTTVSMADQFKRSILVNGLALPDEESSFQPSAVTVNGSELFTKLEKAIDLDGNGTVTAQELATAHSTSWLAEALSHLIVRYESEWGGDMSRWSAITPLMKERAPIWQDELQRIQKLQWWDQVKAVKDFPASPTVYHFHPIGLVGNFVSGRKRHDYDLGQLSSFYETGGRGSITISGGQGDPGGVSYGSYQMTSQTRSRDGSIVVGGVVKDFVSSSDFPWANEFAGLTPGSGAFSDKWRAVVNANSSQFEEVEHEYIRKTHFDIQIQHVIDETGIDLRYHSHAINDVVWSTCVQLGPKTDVVAAAIKNVTAPAQETKEYDRLLISAIYDERGRKNAQGALVHFIHSSAAQQAGVATRYESESVKAQGELSNEADY